MSQNAQNKFTNPLSPHTYYQLFNKMVSEQQSYNRSENPQMFNWRLKFQPLDQYVIPQLYNTKSQTKGKELVGQIKKENFIFPNNEANQYIKLVEEQANHLNSREEFQSQLLQQRKQRRSQVIEDKMDAKISGFKDIEDRISQVTQEQKQIRQDKLQNHFKSTSYRQSRIEEIIQTDHYKSSSMLNQTNEPFNRKFENKLGFIQRFKQTQSSQQTARKIRPIYNQKILLPLQDQDCKLRKCISSRVSMTPLENSVNKFAKVELVSLNPKSAKKLATHEIFSAKNSRDLTNNLKPFDAEAEVDVDGVHSSKQKFRIKNPKQVLNLMQYISQTYVDPQAQLKVNQQKDSIDYNIFDKLNQNLTNLKSVQTEVSEGNKQFRGGKNIKHPNIDPKRNFLDFPTYFFKNYQIHNNGLSSILPQQIIEENENFVTNLQRMINEIED